MKILFYYTYIFLFAIQTSFSWRIFHHGRYYEGNLNALSDKLLTEDDITTSLFDAQDKWFDQILDHFTPTDERTWKQRYHVNDQFYNQSGPIFLYIGGEGPISLGNMIAGQWIQYAKQFGALCFQLEHRYYGNSHPTPNTSTENLRYLSSEQAIADLAYFIESINTEYNLNNPQWILFGGSYAGSLAAWLRYKYPHLVKGAVSSSGPLLAKLDFYEYYRVVNNSLRTHSDACADNILNGFNKMDELLKSTIGQQIIDKKFNLCNPIEKNLNSKNIVNLHLYISDNIAGAVQYNPYYMPNIDAICEIMVNDTIGDAFERLATFVSLWNSINGISCTEYKYDLMINELRNVEWNGRMDREWIYQTCTEFGFYQTSLLFGNQIPLEYYVQECMDIFGPNINMSFLNRAIKLTNNMYGALDLDVSNVVYVHGSIDPWHALGITKTKDNKAPAIFIQGTSHCNDMRLPSPFDPPQLTEARVKIGELIESWLRPL